MVKKELPIIPFDRADDLHHLHVADNSELTLFMAGNQFMVMEEIIAAFQKEHPDIKNIFYETLPPGLALKQILSGGAIFRNNVIDVHPDIYASVNENAMKALEAAGHMLSNDYHLYLHNRLTLMVPAGNPAQITSVADLAADNIRISQPDPQYEDIALHIMDMYKAAGGDALVHRIMEEKRAEGTTILTVVHHRETPLRIAKKTVDVGPVWATEALHARTTGLAFDVVEVGEDLDQRTQINYFVGQLKNAPNRENANKFIDFILSAPTQGIYERYGFLPINEASEKHPHFSKLCVWLKKIRVKVLSA